MEYTERVNDMTIDEIMASDRIMLTAADIAPILGSDPQTIRQTARKHPELIGFPFAFTGTRIKIPRIGFVRWYNGDRPNTKEVDSIGN